VLDDAPSTGAEVEIEHALNPVNTDATAIATTTVVRLDLVRTWHPLFAGVNDGSDASRHCVRRRRNCHGRRAPPRS